MDIRELRIDDRVSHNGDIGKVIEIKTTHVGLMFKDGTSYLYNVNELEPIPLTDELLEKIGFTQVSKYLGDGIDYRFSNDNECRIWHTLLNNSSYEYNIHTNESSKNIKYLHQLQHELFDAGVQLKIGL